MVNRSTRIKLPFSGITMGSLSRKMISGNGMGSVLLSRGGPGAGSSYGDIDEYIHTVGLDKGGKHTRALQKTSMSGSGLSKKLEKSLKKLNVSDGYRKRPNITM